MSTKALAWAWDREGLSVTVKFVLVAMADAAGDTGKSFSSNATICKMTGLLKEDTVSEAQSKLCSLNLISDTGARVGCTGKIKVFQLPPETCKYIQTNPPPDGVLKAKQIPRRTGDSIPRQSPANPPPIPRLAETPYTMDPGSGIREGAGALSPALVKSILDAWNELESVPKCLLLSDKRRRSLKVRLGDKFFSENWKPSIERLKDSRFCNGDNDRGWVATFDWFLQPDSCLKIMEGKYDGKGKANGPAGSKSFDRNKGTLNEGRASSYDHKKIQAARAIRDAGQQVAGNGA